MIPFVGPSHPLPVDRIDLQRSINLYPVRAEQGGEKAETHLMPTPGLRVWSAAGEGPLAAFLSINSASGPVLDGSTFTLTVTRSGSTAGTSTVQWAASGDTFADGQGFERVSYSGVLTFLPGETAKTLSFTLQVTDGTEFAATVTLSSPSLGTFVTDGVGTLTAQGSVDPHWASVMYLHRYNDLENPTTLVDEQGNTWTRNVGDPGDSALEADDSHPPNPLYGGASLYGFNILGHVPYLEHAYSVPLDASGENKFTLDGWASTSANGISGWGFVTNIGHIRVEKQGASLHLRGSFSTGAFDLSAAIPNDVYALWDASYDGTTLRLRINGAVVDSEAIAPGTPLTLESGRIGGSSMSTGDGFWFDESRFTAGVCRHPNDAPYTPTAAEFPGGPP